MSRASGPSRRGLPASRRSDRSRNLCEQLERRVLMSQTRWPLLVDTSHRPVELAPQTIDPRTGISPPNRVADPANIVWTNRATTTAGGAGDTDGFGATFGTIAPLARAVVDAVIVRYEQMIGSFDYPTAGQSYSLSLSMNATQGSGFGASASLSTSLGGKPKSGSITMGTGTNDGNPNSDNGWFLDPTPFDSSEFLGNITNAFAGDAPSTSPAFNKGDFFTVVAAEMTHCMGEFNTLAGWTSHTTNTGIHDDVTTVGNYWVFQGPSISHLGTSDNAGSSDFNQFIHSAEGPSAITWNGINWNGAEDQGNAFYEFGRRYLINNTFALMFKDAYGYLSVNPAKFGTFYSVLNQSTGQVTVRGGAGSSSDNIEIFRSPGNTITVSVNAGDDIPGTGALPGAGSLPSFDTVYNLSEVSSIVVNAGDGDDVIVLDTTDFASTGLSVPITINAGNGDDSLIGMFFGGSLDYLRGLTTFNGEAGNDDISFYDSGNTNGDAYTLTSTSLTRQFFGGLNFNTTESLFLRAETGNNSFNINSTAAGMSCTLDGNNGNDTFNVGSPANNAANIDGALTLTGGNGTDAVNINDFSNAAATTYGITNTTLTRSGAAMTTFGTCESLTLNAGSAGDTINFATGNGNIPMSAFLAGGNDTVNVDSSGYSGIGSQNAITLDGGPGTDVFNYSPNGGSFTGIYSNHVGGSGPQYNYTTFDNLNVLGAAFNDYYILFQTAAGVSTNVNAGDGNDVIAFGGFFAAPYTLDDIDGPVTVNGGNGADELDFIDTQNTLNQTWAISSSNVARTGTPTIPYTNCESAIFYGGSGADTFDVNSTLAATPITVNSGDGADTIDVLDNAAGSFVTVDGQAGLDTVNVNNDSSGVAAVHFNATQDLAALNVRAGGTATMEANGSRVIDSDALTVASSGKLDLTDNDLIVDYVSPSQLATVQALINSARNNGAWNGATGITSTAAASNASHNTTLGAMEASDYKGLYGAGATFDGRAIDTTAVLVKYTYYGDTDFSGKVNFDDYVRTDSGFNNHRTGWLNGDFNGNGAVNFDDYVLIDLAFNTQTATL